MEEAQKKQRLISVAVETEAESCFFEADDGLLGTAVGDLFYTVAERTPKGRIRQTNFPHTQIEKLTLEFEEVEPGPQLVVPDRNLRIPDPANGRAS